MGRNTSISIGNHFESFIENSIADGRFNNASEDVRARLEEDENKIIALRKAIVEGLESGRSVDFDPKKHLASLKVK